MTSKEAKKLKSGDLVLCTHSYPSFSFIKDRIYKVRCVNYYSNGYAIIHIQVDSHGSTSNGWGCNFFELINTDIARILYE